MIRRLRAAALLAMVGWSWIAPHGAQAQLPLPGGSLIVTLTSPANGATVSGTVPVSASVSIVGSLTVSRVEFFRDGNFIGSDSSAPYSVSWNTTTVGNGSHTLVAVGVDVLGVRWNSSSRTVTVSNGPPPDTTRPSVTINQAAGQASPTSASPINFTAVFSEPVSGFTGADVAISGTAGGTKTKTVTGGPSTYNVAVSGMTTSGTVIATVAAGVAQDAAGNTNTASTSTDNQVTFDATAPAPPSTPDLAAASDSGASSTDNLTNDNTPTFIGTAEAGSTVKIFSGGIQVGSGTATGGNYSITTSTLGGGTHSITATATDAANNVSSPSGALSVTIDTTLPTVSINQAAGQADPTKASPINFTVVFSEPVSGFTSADVGIGGTAGGTKTATVTGGPSTYNAAVSGMTTTGTVIATIAAGVAQDSAGNTNTASTSTDNQVTFDATAPAPPSTPDLAAASDSGASSTDNLTNDNTPTFIGTAEAGSTVKIFSGGIQVGSGTAAGGNYSITTSALSGGAHSITATATDAANNISPPSGALSVTIDTTAPTVSINQATGQADPTNAVPINFTVVFSEPVSGFTGSDVAIGGTAGATTAAVSGGPSTYTVAVSGMTSSGTVSATIPAGGASDAAGNTNTASTSTDNSVQFNTTPPAPTITGFSPTSGPVGTDVTITGTNFTGATSVTFNGVPITSGSVVSDTSITAKVPSGATTGPLSVTTPGGTATSSANFTVTGTTPAPTITSFSPTSGPVGTDVTITGTNFTGATSVTFNGVPITSGSVVSDTSITATVPSGATTGPISVTTPAGTATSTSSFTVTGSASVTRSEESAVTFAGTGWTLRGSEIAAFSGGTAASSNVGGDTATFTFTGTAVSWIGLKCNVCGIATVSIDGAPATTVNTAGPGIVDADPATPLPTSEPVFTASGLPAGTHTLEITVTGTFDTTGSSGAHIIVDAFDVTGSASAATLIEDTDPAVTYTGDWIHGTSPIASGGTFAEAQLAGAAVTVSFTGTAVRWLSYRNTNNGIADAKVDGVFVGKVDTYASTPGLAVVFGASGLSPGAHTLTIEVTGTKNPASTDTWVIIDAFEVTP